MLVPDRGQDSRGIGKATKDKEDGGANPRQ